MDNTQFSEQKKKWVFELLQKDTLQFHITSEDSTDAPVLIEGHEISMLLDYLYEHRELIYEATHDQALTLQEALESAKNAPPPKVREKRRIETTLYFDDGVQRTRATSSES